MRLPDDVQDPVAAASYIATKYADAIDAARRVSPASHNRAGDLGHPCDRYLVYQRTRGDEAELPSPELQAIFWQGNNIEAATIQELQSKLGLEIVWSQRPYYDELHDISGMIDGGVGLSHHREALPLEFKGIQGAKFSQIPDGLAGLEFLLHTRDPWLRRYLVQCAVYIHLTGERAVLLVLRDKWFWGLKVIPILRDRVQHEIDLALQRALATNRHIADGTLPDRIDPSLVPCSRCPYESSVCFPSRTGKGVEFVVDDALLKALDDREALVDAAKRYKDLDDACKRRIKPLGENAEIVVGGRYEVKTSTHERKGPDVSRHSVAELRKLALVHGVKNGSRMRKDQLAAAVSHAMRTTQTRVTITKLEQPLPAAELSSDPPLELPPDTEAETTPPDIASGDDDER